MVLGFSAPEPYKKEHSKIFDVPYDIAETKPMLHQLHTSSFSSTPADYRATHEDRFPQILATSMVHLHC